MKTTSRFAIGMLAVIDQLMANMSSADAETMIEQVIEGLHYRAEHLDDYVAEETPLADYKPEQAE